MSVLCATICALYSLQITGGHWRGENSSHWFCVLGRHFSIPESGRYIHQEQGAQEWLYTTLDTAFARTHTHTHKDMFVLAVTSKWTQGPSGNQSFLITRQRIHKQIHARTEAANTTAYRAKGTNAFNEAISLPRAAHERVGVYFSIKSFIMYPANQTLISLSHYAEGNKDLLHQPRQHGPHTHNTASTQTHKQQALNEY